MGIVLLYFWIDWYISVFNALPKTAYVFVVMNFSLFKSPLLLELVVIVMLCYIQLVVM